MNATSRAKPVLLFVLQQFIATWGVGIIANLSLASLFVSVPDFVRSMTIVSDLVVLSFASVLFAGLKTQVPEKSGASELCASAENITADQGNRD